MKKIINFFGIFNLSQHQKFFLEIFKKKIHGLKMVTLLWFPKNLRSFAVRETLHIHKTENYDVNKVFP